MANPVLALGPRSRKVARYVGYVVLALVTFVFALQWTFPYHRVKDKIIESLASKYDVTISKVERGFMPGTMTLRSVSLTARAKKPDDKPQVFYIDRIDVDVGLLGLVRGVAAIDLDIKIGKGTIAGTIEASRANLSIDLSMRGVQGDDLPPLTEAIGLPLVGGVSADVAMSIPKGDWRKARGAIKFACPRGCVYGDDKTKLRLKVKKPSSEAFVKDGVEFGHVVVDKLAAKIDLKNGKMTLSSWEFESTDGEMHAELVLKLGSKFKDSEIERGCFRYRGSPALEKRDLKTFGAISFIGGMLGDDNLFHVKLEGKIGDAKPRPRTCAGGDGDGEGDGKPDRPALGKPVGGTAQDDVFVKNEPNPTVLPTPVVPDAGAPAAPGAGSGSAGTGTGTGTGSAGATGAGVGSAGSGADSAGAGAVEAPAAPAPAPADTATTGEQGTVQPPVRENE